MNAKELIAQANSCYYGEGAELNLEKAAQLYMEAANLEDPEAMCLYGYCLRKGIGVEENPEEAFKLFSASADCGFAMAQYNLGYCYEHGIGVDQDYDLSRSWYERAEENGYTEQYC